MKFKPGQEVVCTNKSGWDQVMGFVKICVHGPAYNEVVKITGYASPSFIEIEGYGDLIFILPMGIRKQGSCAFLETFFEAMISDEELERELQSVPEKIMEPVLNKYTMKSLVTIVLFCFTATLFAQTDSTKVEPGDTIRIDLKEFQANDRIQILQQELKGIEMEAKLQASVLQERAKSVDREISSILLSEALHNKQYDRAREVQGKPKIVGNFFVIVYKKLVAIQPKPRNERKN